MCCYLCLYFSFSSGKCSARATVDATVFYGAQLLPGHIWLKLRPATNVCVDCKHRGKEISPVLKAFHQRAYRRRISFSPRLAGITVTFTAKQELHAKTESAPVLWSTSNEK